MSALANKIGLVTVLFKSDNVLEGFFKSISTQTHENYFLYIIDNSPSENTDRILSDLSIKFSVHQFLHIKSESNVGVAAGNNTGIKLALQDNCEYVLLLNNDIEFEQHDLFSQMLLEAKGKNNFLFIPKILFFDNRKIWMAGGRLDTWKPMTIHIGEGDHDQDKYNHPRTFNYAPTCFMLIHKSVFQKVGLMDEKYFVYFDDTDFVYRATQMSYQIYYLPKLVVLHKISSSTGGKESLFSIYYGNRNRIYFIRKNLTGLVSLTAYVYTFVTRAIKIVAYDKERTSKLVRGLIDGFKMSL